MAMEGMDLDAVQPVLNTLNNAVKELQTLISSTQNAYQPIESSWRARTHSSSTAAGRLSRAH